MLIMCMATRCINLIYMAFMRRWTNPYELHESNGDIAGESLNMGCFSVQIYQLQALQTACLAACGRPLSLIRNSSKPTAVSKPFTCPFKRL